MSTMQMQHREVKIPLRSQNLTNLIIANPPMQSSTDFQHLGQTEVAPSIKAIFDDDISPRRLAYITSLNDLLIVLHSQHILNRTNLVRLKQLLPASCDRFIEERFVQLQQLVGDDGRNIYADMCRLPSPPAPLAAAAADRLLPTYYDCAPPTVADPLSGYESRKALIYRRLAEEIGRKWRDLGRELGVAEGRLDEIDELQSRNSGNKMHAVFRVFEERTVGNRRQALALLDGLEQVRRRDLVRLVQEICMGNGNE